MKIHHWVGLVAIGLTTSGCASVIEGTSQLVTVNTNPAGATCTLNRQPDGVIAQIASTPAGVTIKKTKYDITIKRNKPGFQEATHLDHSGAAGATFGNIVLGGGVGWAVDSASGADNKYDSPVNVTLVPSAVGAAPAATPTPAQGGAPGFISSKIWLGSGRDLSGFRAHQRAVNFNHARAEAPGEYSSAVFQRRGGLG